MNKRTIRVAVLASLLLGSLMAAGAQAQYFGRNKIQYKDHKWNILSTPHFDIHYYDGADMFAVRAGLVLEDGYGMLSGKLKEVLPWKVPVILYSAHGDFLQTNIDPSIIGEGVQAFAEPRRRRIVLPFTSSFKEFQHTAIHELSHVFTFQIIYNRMLDNVFTRSYLPGMPLWVAEGVAEYLSVGWDADSDMYIRDAVIHDYLIPFYGVGGFYVYKEGQSVFNYLAETYGHQKVIEFLNSLGSTRSATASLGKTIGLTEAELHDEWSRSLRKHYWPLYPDKIEVSDVGRRLTDHVKDRGYYNSRPILSPDGERIAFFSDRSGLLEILVMSALDGKIISKVVTGSRSNRYESLHFLTSSMAWDPGSERVAFVAKSKGHDALFIRHIFNGHEQRVEIESDGLAAPAWSPDGNDIALSATFAGQTDLVMVDLNSGSIRRLTDDAADQLTPRFFPDGKKLVYVHYPEVTRAIPADFNGDTPEALAEIDFLDPRNVAQGASYDIWEYDIESGEQRALVASPGDDTEPIILADDKTILYASDVSGINNLHTGNIETGEYYRFTDVLGGLFSPSVNEEKGRIAFTAFVRGGHDVYVSDDLKGLMARRYADMSPGILAYAPDEAERDMRDMERAQMKAAAKAAAKKVPSKQVKNTVAPPVEVSAAGSSPEPVSESTTPAGGIDLDAYAPRIRFPRMGSADSSRVVTVSPSFMIDETPPGEEAAFKGATIARYRTKIAPDYIGQGGGLYYSTGFGFGISNAIAMGDMLGDHYLLFAFNIYRNIQDSDFLLTYSYLKKRADYSVGIFQYKSYLDSRVTSLGEGFSTYQLFSERNYGLFGNVSIPFNKFYRMEFGLQTYVSDRTFFAGRGFNAIPTGDSTRRLFEPSIAFIHDSSFFGPFGPVEGSRWRVSLSRGLAYSSRDVSRFTGIVDYRRYKTLFYRNSFAVRVMGAASAGAEPRFFYLGGPTTLRGFDYLEYGGTKMWLTSLEYRFPMVDALILGWPGRWGFTNIGGSVFFDAGSTWDDVDPIFFDRTVNGARFQDIKSDIGIGTYMYFGYFLLNFQFAWPTDLRTVSNEYQFHFYMGPTF